MLLTPSWAHPSSRFVRANLSVSSTTESSSSRAGLITSERSPSRQISANRSGSGGSSTQAGLPPGSTVLGWLQITRWGVEACHFLPETAQPGGHYLDMRAMCPDSASHKLSIGAVFVLKGY
jgi:hypothetical protein